MSTSLAPAPVRSASPAAAVALGLRAVVGLCGGPSTAAVAGDTLPALAPSATACSLAGSVGAAVGATTADTCRSVESSVDAHTGVMPHDDAGREETVVIDR